MHSRCRANSTGPGTVPVATHSLRYLSLYVVAQKSPTIRQRIPQNEIFHTLDGLPFLIS